MRASVANTIKKARERAFLRAENRTPEPQIRWIHTEEEARQWLIDTNAMNEAGEWTPGQPNPLAGKWIAAPAVYRDYEEYARIKDERGGRGSGKTDYTAKKLMREVIFHGKKLLACREIMDSIEESSKAELEKAVVDLGAEHLVVITDKAIKARGGGKVTFIGLAKTGEKIKGYSDYDLCWIEEAATVSYASWKRLIPTIRKPGSEIWLTWNPNSTSDDTWKRFESECIYPEFKEDGTRYHLKKTINFPDNPFFGLTALAAEEEFLRDADPDEHLHIYLGQPVGALANAIIKPTWVLAALDLHELINPDYDDGAHLIGGYDVGGTVKGDASAVAMHLNSVLCYLNEFREIDPVASADFAYREAARMECAEIRFDTIGVGLGAKGAIRERNERREKDGFNPIRFLPFDVSAPVMRPEQMIGPKRRNKDHYLNLKAQSWDSLSKRFFHAYLFRKYWEESGGVMDYVIEKMGEERVQHMISIDTVRIDPKLRDKLMGELTAPTWIKSEGKLQVETKDMLKKRGIASTNDADAVVMAFFKMDRGVLSETY